MRRLREILIKIALIAYLLAWEPPRNEAFKRSIYFLNHREE